MIKTLRVYVDTSVFGGCFENEFAEASRRLFTEIQTGKFILVISSLTIQELDRAPAPVQRVLAEIPTNQLEVIPEAPAIDQLREAYLQAHVVGPSSSADAQHIAAAAVAEVDMVVSWNFRHIVHYEKINGYHAVNLLNGYKPIPIYSPREVVSL